MVKIFSPIKERAIKFITHFGISKEFFFETTGIAASNFKGKGAESELGGEKIVNILTSYPNLNAEWLLMGSGDMVKNNSSSIQMELEENNAIDNRVALLEKQIQTLDLSLRQMVHTQKLMHVQYLETLELLRLLNPPSDKIQDSKDVAKKDKKSTGNQDEVTSLRKRGQSN